MSTTTTLVQRKPTPTQTQNDESKSAIERLSHGVTISGIPSFTSVEKKRHWMLEHMAGAFRVFARKGFAEGLAGHISLRDPGKLKAGPDGLGNC
jgi:hypothetical protein